MQDTQSRQDDSKIPNEDAIEVVSKLLEALRAKDLERASALFHDDIEYQNVPFAPNRGRARVERTLRKLFRIPGDVGIRVQNIAARGDVVLTERIDSLRSPFLDLDLWVCGTFQVSGGKIVLWRDYFDLATFTLQLLTAPIRRLLRERANAPTT